MKLDQLFEHQGYSKNEWAQDWFNDHFPRGNMDALVQTLSRDPEGAWHMISDRDSSLNEFDINFLVDYLEQKFT